MSCCGHTNLNWKPLISALLVLAFWAQDSCRASDFAVSPVDSSVWLGTSSEGLLRFGRNGRSIRYTVQDGQLSSNKICALAFDVSGVLFILDGEGSITRYSSTEGFASVSKADLPLPVSEQFFGIPETEIPSEPEQVYEAEEVREKSFPGWLWFVLGALLGAGLGLAATLLNNRARATAVPAEKSSPVVAHPVQAPAPPVQTPKPEPVMAAKPAPVTAAKPAIVPAADSPETDIEEALQRSSFGRQVWDLVVAHLSSPAYGVEEVARDLNLSRIHVNRKLKAETGYSPSAVFKFIRMNHASKLLLEGKRTVAEVAQDCGFSSASYFSTAFKDYYSQSPSEFLAEQANPAQ